MRCLHHAEVMNSPARLRCAGRARQHHGHRAGARAALPPGPAAGGADRQRLRGGRGRRRPAPGGDRRLWARQDADDAGRAPRGGGGGRRAPEGHPAEPLRRLPGGRPRRSSPARLAGKRGAEPAPSGAGQRLRADRPPRGTTHAAPRPDPRGAGGPTERPCPELRRLRALAQEMRPGWRGLPLRPGRPARADGEPQSRFNTAPCPRSSTGRRRQLDRLALLTPGRAADGAGPDGSSIYG